MKKLKLIPFVPKPKIVEKPAPTGYESPIGWWSVSTEGDCEGRTTDQLGEFYGHVAEIAFHLADKVCYSLNFRPIKNRPKGKRLTLQAAKNSVWIQLGIESNTWSLTPDARAMWFETWLDCSEDITVAGTTSSATYYASAYISIK